MIYAISEVVNSYDRKNHLDKNAAYKTLGIDEKTAEHRPCWESVQSKIDILAATHIEHADPLYELRAQLELNEKTTPAHKANVISSAIEGSAKATMHQYAVEHAGLLPYGTIYKQTVEGSMKELIINYLNALIERPEN